MVDTNEAKFAIRDAAYSTTIIAGLKKIKFTGEKRASSVVVCISLARLKSVNLLNGRKFCKAITHVAYGPADRLAQVKEEGTTE